MSSCWPAYIRFMRASASRRSGRCLTVKATLPARRRSERAAVASRWSCGSERTSALKCPRRRQPPITPAEASHRFNLSSWTLKHQALVIFLLALITLFGILSYSKLAQSEDPAVHLQGDGGPHLLARRDRAAGAGGGHRPHRTQAAGNPGRRLHAQLLAPRRVDALLHDQGLRAARAGAGNLVPGAQESRRHRQHAARRASRARSSTTSSATSTRTSTRSKATASRFAQLHDYAERLRTELLRVPTSTRSTSSPTRSSASTSRSRTRNSRNSG